MVEQDISSKLRSGVFFVEGAKRAALYDTTRGNVYSLNQEAVQIIGGGDNNPEFWSTLISMQLAIAGEDSVSEATAPEVEIPKPGLGVGVTKVQTREKPTIELVTEKGSLPPCYPTCPPPCQPVICPVFRSPRQ